jgi:hypothetical protein
MRFKLFFNEKEQKLDFNCLTDSNTDIILPENPEQHVYYPIPNDLQREMKAALMPLIEDENISQEIADLQVEIKNILEKRRQLIYDLRMKLNPSIIEVCKQFKEDNAEYFI